MDTTFRRHCQDSFVKLLDAQINHSGSEPFGSTQIEPFCLAVNAKLPVDTCTEIILYGHDLTVHLQLLYNANDIAQHAKLPLFNKARLAKDFFGEYCNLLAGKIKSQLEGSNRIFGMSLPLSTDFDGSDYGELSELALLPPWYGELWQISNEDCGIALISRVAYMAENHLFPDLHPPTKEAEQHAHGEWAYGEVEFL